MLKKLFTLSFFSTLSLLVFAQSIDVQHYQYHLELTDASDTIKGRAVVQVTFLKNAEQVLLHLVSPDKSGAGMTVSKVLQYNVPLNFTATNNQLQIQLSGAAKKGETKVFEIVYAGVPQDGLIISKNKYGDRTFFADNWPNRAHNWIPCNDIPGDKATVEFLVTAPEHYQVVSNGIQVEETNLAGNKKFTHWKEVIPIPTKVMVIGVARFAVKQYSDSTSTVPVTAWVYPQDREKGFYDYTLAKNILNFFSAYVGPYAFQKLANVQSKTIFGGMENASAIFYAENTVTGDQNSEALVAHEIAHQWFGNMATEKTFAHLWLSEGFATYLTDIYLERKYGTDTLQKRLGEERQEVLDFSRQWNGPVVDSVSALMDLLNANSYQKGAWVLHMLRRQLGDSVFQKVIQTYYAQYKGGNADTNDFQKVAEKVSGKKLGSFFGQWLWQPTIPVIEVSWRYTGGNLEVTVEQKSKKALQFPLTIGYTTQAGKKDFTINVQRSKQTFLKKLEHKPSSVVLDPNTDLLFTGSIKGQ